MQRSQRTLRKDSLENKSAGPSCRMDYEAVASTPIGSKDSCNRSRLRSASVITPTPPWTRKPRRSKSKVRNWTRKKTGGGGGIRKNVGNLEVSRVHPPRKVIASVKKGKYKLSKLTDTEDSNAPKCKPAATGNRATRSSTILALHKVEDEAVTSNEESFEWEDEQEFKIKEESSEGEPHDHDEETPKASERRTSKRRMAVDSSVASGSQTMCPNPETYFLAKTRISYKKMKVTAPIMNDSMKGKRRGRKRKMTMPTKNDNLPEQSKSNFSVTAEAMKANVDAEDFIEGSTHDVEVERLFQDVKKNEFSKWLTLFRAGFNVMLHGYGSKLELLEEFRNLVNDHYLVVTINGLFPKLTPRKLLNGLCEFVDPKKPTPQGHNIEVVARNAVAILSSNVDAHEVYIIINNFDNMILKNTQMLSVICHLAKIPFIHILATSDTVNAPLGLGQSQNLQLRFCWAHCPTFKQYGEELKWIPGIYGDETKTVTQKGSLKYVLQSLTGNARKAFAILGQMQLKQMKSHSAKKSKDVYDGVKFEELAKACREKFIAHSDYNLRTLLVEFFDHKLIRLSRKGRSNNLIIELSIEALEDVLSSELAGLA